MFSCHKKKIYRQSRQRLRSCSCQLWSLFWLLYSLESQQRKYVRGIWYFCSLVLQLVIFFNLSFWKSGIGWLFVLFLMDLVLTKYSIPLWGLRRHLKYGISSINEFVSSIALTLHLIPNFVYLLSSWSPTNTSLASVLFKCILISDQVAIRLYTFVGSSRDIKKLESTKKIFSPKNGSKYLLAWQMSKIYICCAELVWILVSLKYL